jgi:hypothetical protein
MTCGNDTHLNAEITTINVVTEEKVSSFCRVTAHLEKFHQIKVLAVDIPAHRNRGIHFEQIRFILQHLRSHVYDPKRLFLRQTALTAKMALEEVEIRLAAILRRKELVFRRRD